MSIGQQFAGLDMRNLIGGPLTAAADASVQLARSTASFINDVGFDSKGNTRTVHFKYNNNSMGEDGTLSKNEMDVEVPLLAIVPIPNLQIDEVNILFDMEVKQSEKSESSTDVTASTSVSAGFWGVKVNISGSVSVHNQNTRSSDNSAKYHVDVMATNHGTPEGLARVLDMMAANVAPILIGSQALDENGKSLIGEKKEKNDKLKALKAQKEDLVREEKSARNIFETDLEQFKKFTRVQQNNYLAALQSLDVKVTGSTEEDDKKRKLYSDSTATINKDWGNLQNNAESTVGLASTTKSEKDAHEITALTKLSKVKDDGSIEAFADADNKSLSLSYDTAVKSCRKLALKTEAVASKQKEIDNLLSGNTETVALVAMFATTEV